MFTHYDRGGTKTGSNMENVGYTIADVFILAKVTSCIYRSLKTHL